MPDQHLICEASVINKDTGRRALHPALHLRPTRQSGTTLCDLPVMHGTMIPLAAWGAEEGDGIAWCKRCARSGKDLLAEARFEEARSLKSVNSNLSPV
jgi:hypothetical protein